MIILSIDLSLRGTGYCIFKDSELVKYGVINTDNSDSMFDRILYIQKILDELIISNSITNVCIENVAFGARGAVVYQLQGSHLAVCLNIYKVHKIEPVALAITTVKKQFTGSGRSDKKQMLETVPKDIREMFEKTYCPSRNLYDLVDSYAVGIVYLNRLKEKIL